MGIFAFFIGATDDSAGEDCTDSGAPADTDPVDTDFASNVSVTVSTQHNHTILDLKERICWYFCRYDSVICQGGTTLMMRKSEYGQHSTINTVQPTPHTQEKLPQTQRKPEKIHSEI